MSKEQTKLKNPVHVQRREKVHHSLAHREKEGTCEQSADQAKNPSTGSAPEKVHHSLAYREKERTCEQSADQAKNPSTGSAAGKGAPLISI